MNLCIDVGNSQTCFGVFVNDKLVLQDRFPIEEITGVEKKEEVFQDQLIQGGLNPASISAVTVCSVVPSVNQYITLICEKQFQVKPLFIDLSLNIGLELDVLTPEQLGADLIAAAVGSIKQYPNNNIIIVDFGTATTLSAISSQAVYRGGAILPGLNIAMQSLANNAAQLSTVTIAKPESVLGRTTDTHIQSGLYYGHLGGIKEIIEQLNNTCFSGDSAVVIATGGYANLFEQENLFAANLPDLVLEGMHAIWQQNQS